VNSVGARTAARTSAVLRWLAPVVGIAAFLGVWELFVRVFDIPEFELPAPSAILANMRDDPGFYLRNTWVTFREAALGFTVAAVLALVVATVAAASPFLERALEPLVVLFQVTPIIAYAPAIVLWVGTGFRPILIITVIVCFAPFFFNGVTGLLSVDPAALELLRSVDASPREVFWRLRLPNALPYLFAAARIAVGLALVGAVLGEFFALVPSGLGVAIKKAQAFTDTLQLWGSIFSLALLGSVIILLLGVLERNLLRWHASQTLR
jgi:NitT/TauT family transport system permease protein